MSPSLLNATITELIANKVFQVLFTGGECLLMKESLFSAISRIIDSGIDCTVNSNLTLVEKADAETLHRIGVRGILTSVSSYERERHDRIFNHKGALVKTMRGIRLCTDAGINVAASMVVIKENVNDVIQTGLMLKSVGVKQFFATKASPPLNAVGFQKFMISRDEMLRVMADLNILRIQHGMNVGILECYPLCSYGLPEKYPFVSSRRCSAGITTVTIGADGGIRPCSHSDKTYGNIANEGLRKSWEAMGEQRDGSMLPSVCRKCSLFAHCSGGCRVDALYCSGRQDALDPYANPALVPGISVDEKTIDLIPEAQKLHVNRKLKSRVEAIGVMCVDADFANMPIILTKDSYDLVTNLSGKIFGVEDVCHLTELSLKDAQLLCSLLVRDRIFQKEDGS